MHTQIFPSPKSDIVLYDVALIVAGSRYYEDYHHFSKVMFEHRSTFGNLAIIYISGAAKTGADNLIIRWCKEHRFPWVEFPADWDRFNKRAGFIRNAEMSDSANALIVFWDGISNGTKNMIDLGERKKFNVRTVLIDVNKKE